MLDERFLREYRIGCRCKHSDGFTLEGVEASYAPDLTLEPKHIEVRLAFDLDAAIASGSVTTTVVANRDRARSLALDAVAFEDVSVRDPSGRALSWRYDGKRIAVSWNEPIAAGEERRLEVCYRVREPVSGMHFTRPDQHYPSRPRFVITDHETERARYWLPCVDYPAVRTTYDFHLTAPAELTILANGVLAAESTKSGVKTAHWHLDYPCPSYLACLAIGRFVRFDDEPVGGRPIAYFATAGYTPEQLARTFGPTPRMMSWLEQRLARPFPFKKYYQIAVPEMGGAMENISLVTWTDLCMLDETWALEFRDAVDSTNIHEMAHAYFGDAIVCRHFEHSWLKESWAVYIETVWLEENAGRNERDYDLHVNAESYFDEADNRYVRPIVTRKYNSSWDLFDRHLYPGGAWRIHMLRERLGDGAFWSAVRDYVATYSERVVETEDFRRKLEEHSGLNLTRFFDEWVYAPGYPKLAVSFRHDKERGEGTFVVEQKQRDDKKGIGLFSFRLEIDFEDDAGFHAVEVAVEKERHVLTLALPASPKQICIDPRQKVLFGLECNPGDDQIRRSVTDGPTLAVRIWAARELIKTGTRPNARAVEEAMRNEPFWGVRAAVGTALGNAKGSEAIEPLAAMLGREEDPRALAPLAAACGKIRDPRLRAALLEFLRKDLPYRARATALESLGAQHDERDLDLLVAESRRDTLHSLVPAGAFAGLGKLRSERAFRELCARVRYGREPDVARPAAVEALGESTALLARERKEEAAELLADLTRDPGPRVRMRAAAALAAQGVASAIPALTALTKLQPHQDTPAIERLIRKVRNGTPGEEVAALRKQVDEITERFRKLEERLQNSEAILEQRGKDR